MPISASVRAPGVARTHLLVLLLCTVLLGTGVGLSLPARAAPCTQTDPIELKYCQLGGPASVLGSPVGTQYTVGSGRAQDYQRGSIYWTSAIGAREVHGGIWTHYRQLGGPLGFLGFPLTDERGASDGIGRFNDFQGGSIYWTRATGAWELHGGIRTKWRALGAERSVLKYPVTDERVTPDGIGAYNHFQGGSIYWTRATGAHEVHGGIRTTWANLGWERGPLGYPITDEYTVNGGRQSDFQGGFLRFTSATRIVRVALLAPYQRSGTWVTRFRFSREYAGTNPPIRPDHVDVMANAGVDTIYIQAAADDSRYPDLISPDLLGQFLTRAHARGMKVVAWYLPRFLSTDADLRRLQAMANFRAGGQAFDAIGVDIEDTTAVPNVDIRNGRLVDLSRRLHNAQPNVTLSAIVLPPVVTDVLNTAYWPRFPWRELAPYYQVWMPMAYWSNRTDPTWSDPYRYITENIRRTRSNLGEPCAAVSVIGGYGTTETATDYAAMARAASDTGAVGVSIFDWTTTPTSVWPAVRDYNVRGC